MNVYALLVGIDEYQSPVPRLRGCKNDVNQFHDFLKDRYPETSLQVKKLLDQQATRKAVMLQFEEHFRPAKAGDVAVFYYSGHGATEPAPPEFWTIEPTRENQTVVCYDSRQPGGWDLADKELAVLIHRLTARSGLHCLVVLDCCHSGSGTRQAVAIDGVRRVPLDTRSRSLKDYDGLAEILRDHSVGAGLGRAWLELGPHVLLAACMATEEAREVHVDGRPHGALSAALIESLRGADPSLSYGDLFRLASARVKSLVNNQNPRLECTRVEPKLAFLNGSLGALSDSLILSYDANLRCWALDGGLLRGLSAPAHGKHTEISYFALDSSTDDLVRLRNPLGCLKVLEVYPAFSKVESPQADTSLSFKAVVTQLPLPVLRVLLKGETETVRGCHSPFWEYVESVESGESDEDYRVVGRAGQFFIRRPQDDWPVTKPVSSDRLTEVLEHIARWEALLRLSAPSLCGLGANPIQLEVCDLDQRPLSAPYRLEYGHQEEAVQFLLRITNRTRVPLRIAIVDLAPNYKLGPWGIQSDFLIGAGKSEFVPNSEGRLEWEAWIAREDVHEVTDWLKVVATTTPIDLSLLAQDALPEATREEAATPGTRSIIPPDSPLQQLFRETQTRDVGRRQAVPSWASCQISITIARLGSAVAVPSLPDQFERIAPNVRVLGHSGLRASIKAVTQTEASRGLSEVVPSVLADISDPLFVLGTRGQDQGLSAIEVQFENGPAVSKEAPLCLLFEGMQLSPDEWVMPLGFDGEFFLPIGRSQQKRNGLEVHINSLPSGGPGTRSVSGAFQVVFRKFAKKLLGGLVDYEYPVLSMVSVDKDGELIRVTDPAEIRSAVRIAPQVLLFVHGIFGDTDVMALSAFTSTRLHESYPVVLCYDYESLNDSLPTTAQTLKERLAAVGLDGVGEKRLHIIAHSMGGLVSRLFIEHCGGNQVVRRLTTMGTPHQGSPWSGAEDQALWLVSLAANKLGSIPPVSLMTSLCFVAGKAVGALAGQIEKLDVTLDTMKPGSDVLKLLANGPDPGVPYDVIAGNVLSNGSQLELKKQSLFNRLFRGGVELPFFGAPNDIAVTVESGLFVPEARQPAPQKAVIDCDHLSYFTHPKGLEALAGVAAHLQSAG